jgi:hypothetical protein
MSMFEAPATQIAPPGIKVAPPFASHDLISESLSAKRLRFW